MQTKHLILAIAGVALIAFLVTREVPSGTSFVKSEVTTGMFTGTFVTDESGQHFVLVDGEPEPILVPLSFDTLSACAAGGGAAPCVALSTTYDVAFGGRTVSVEGTLLENTFLVRKLLVLAEGEPLPRTPTTGSIFISWNDGVRLIRACEVTGIVQTPALDVYLGRPDGTHLRTVEPKMDEVLRVYDESLAHCPSVPVTTDEF